MGRQRPERPIVEELLKDGTPRKTHEIAEAAGLIESIGYDKAVDYVRRVRRDLRKKGEIAPPADRFATDEERLEDITVLFELRQGKMSKDAAYFMLLLNCYYRLRSEDDDIHMRAIDDTYEKNGKLEEPLTMAEAIHVCEIALAQYMQSIDEEKNRAAKERGYPGSGLNYTSESLIQKCEITEEELNHLKSIKGDSHEQ